ncbi:MAG TPA: benzoate-CoA ligase family protein [Jatrophihabitans sp.]|jgi:benzoate-CoA ligase family protein
MSDERFNAAEYLLDRRVAAGDGDRLALTGVGGDLTYRELLDRVQRTATVLTDLGLQPEQRLLMFMADSPGFVALYLAAMRIGAVPVPVSTMLHADGLNELLLDSRARLLAVSAAFVETAQDAIVGAADLNGVLVDEAATLSTSAVPVHQLDELVTQASPSPEVYRTTEDSPAFWLYTSGTTGKSKAAMHRHGAIKIVCQTYGQQVLGIGPSDRCLSAAKAFFAYGLGNSVLFPLSVGACAILEPAPSRPDLITERAQQFHASLFFAGPTFFANMLRSELPTDALDGVRLAASAGEVLPATLYRRWTEHFGVDIIDGIGMTEMLHIFLSNRPGNIEPGTTGVAVAGYDLRIVDETGQDVAPGTPGTLLVRGDSTATGYWSRYDASRQVFQGEWLRTGDTYVLDRQGHYTCLGRTGDMLKASGMWVSPGEVESRLLAHAAVSQAVVVAATDHDGLEKPVAFVMLRPGGVTTEHDLIEFCREGLPSFKRPRRVVFVEVYPTTSTGKVRRVELREMAVGLLDAGHPTAV